MEELKQKLSTLVTEVLPGIIYPFEIFIDEFEEVTITFEFGDLSMDRRYGPHDSREYILKIINQLNLKVLITNGIKYQLHMDGYRYGVNDMATGYLKVDPEYFRIRKRVLNNYFELLAF